MHRHDLTTSEYTSHLVIQYEVNMRICASSAAQIFSQNFFSRSRFGISVKFFCASDKYAARVLRKKSYCTARMLTSYTHTRGRRRLILNYIIILILFVAIISDKFTMIMCMYIYTFRIINSCREKKFYYLTRLNYSFKKKILVLKKTM